MSRVQIPTVFTMIVILFSVVANPHYKLVLKKIEQCENPVPPYEKDNNTKLTITSYNKSNKTILKGTWMSKQDLRGYFWRFKYGKEQSGVIKYKFEYDKISCRNIIPKLILLASKVKYDQKNCVFYKGYYAFDNIDLSKIDQGVFMFPARELGESVMVLNFYKPTETSYCLMILVEYIRQT